MTTPPPPTPGRNPAPTDPAVARAFLRERVLAHAPADAAETAHRDHMLRWLAGDTDPFDRHTYVPGHATGSALIVEPTGARFVLIFHGKLHRWLQPGGHPAPGETNPAEIAVREAREETGLVLDAARARLIDLDVHEIPARKDQPAHFHFDFRYLFVTAHAAIHPADDVTEARWVRRDEMEPLQLDPGLLRMIDKALRILSL